MLKTSKNLKSSGRNGRNFAKLTPHEVLVLADAIDSKGDETVNIAILGDKKLKAEDINDSQTVAGPGRSSVGAKVTLSSLAKPTASEVRMSTETVLKIRSYRLRLKKLQKTCFPAPFTTFGVFRS